jgi:hypothetical protein
MIRELIEMGSEVRNIGQEGLIFTVFDKKISISGINWEITHLSLDQPIAALWTNDPSYGQYLTSTFEMLWGQSVPAGERIQQLLEQGPPQV